MRMRLRNRRRRGITLPEVLIAATITLAITTLLASFSRFQSMAWNRSSSSFSAQQQGQLAVQRIAPSIREARQVILSQSGTSRVTLQMPAFNTTGGLIVPLQNGRVVSYYLSDTSGDPARSGAILWRSVNGVADTAWSRDNSGGRTTLAADGLRFSYYPATDPESVTLELTAVDRVGPTLSEFSTTQEVLLRNKGL